MKPFKFYKRISAQLLICFALLIACMVSCKKIDTVIEHTNSASLYSSDVIDKWITLQIRLMRDATGIPNHTFSRPYAYSGITAFEALAPGTSVGVSINGKWNGLTNLPHPDIFKKYFWPASVNAALASINRDMFSTANATDKTAIDSLETALNTSFMVTENAGVINQSKDFGKSVAKAVFDWSETDGYKSANALYTPPVGPGLWVPTPPAFAPPVTPYWGGNRPTVAGSINNTQPGAPTAYSEDPKSAFYQMAKKVYDVSQSLTDEQKAMALFWRDLPGVTSPGHWESILQQVLKQTHSRLDKAALAYAVTGACGCDALIGAGEPNTNIIWYDRLRIYKKYLDIQPGVR